MTKTITCFFIILFAGSEPLFGQETWVLKSVDENVPVPYAKVTELNSRQWTSSNPEGEFHLDTSLFSDDAKFSISAMGYADTIVSPDLMTKSRVLFLKPRFVEMEEHLVVSKALKKHVIGDFDLPLSLSKAEGRMRNPITTNRYAVYFEFPGKKTKILSRISFYLTDLGDSDPKMTVRVLVSDEIKKPKEGDIHAISQFKDIRGKSHSLYEANGYGWAELDLSGDEIIIPEKYRGAFIVFDVINEGEEPHKTMVIPFQNQSSEKIFAAFYNTGGSIGILNKRKDHFAVVLEYFTD